jgi:hypothetical protein
VYRTSDLEIGWGYMRQVEMPVVTAGLVEMDSGQGDIDEGQC